jgi:DNA-binding SARP family transcriptional activator
MTGPRVRLFRKLEIQRDGHILADINARKVQDSFRYPLLPPDRTRRREILASLLWRENSLAPALLLQEAQW